MGKMSTLIYMYSNFEETEIISSDFSDINLKEFDDILKFLEENTKKVPDSIVNNIIEFAGNYS